MRSKNRSFALAAASMVLIGGCDDCSDINSALDVPDPTACSFGFTMSLDPATFDLATGATGQTTVRLNPTRGQNNVTLSVPAPAMGVTFAFSPSVLNVSPAGGQVTSTLTVANTSAAYGSHDVSVDGVPDLGPGGSESICGDVESSLLTLTVPDPNTAYVEIQPAAATISALGASGALVLSATAFNSLDEPLTAVTFTWGSDDPSVAMIAPSGPSATVTGVADGMTQIWASADPAGPTSLEGRSDITVAAPLPSPFVLEWDFDASDPTGGGVQRLFATNGASDTVQHAPSAGNPNGADRMVHVLPPGTALSPTTITVLHLLSASYDPQSASQGGAIAYIDYYVDQRVESEPVGAGLVLTQAGTSYQYRQPDISSTSWESVSFLNLTAADFVQLSPAGSGLPDFSASAPPISFTFSRISSYMQALPTSHGHYIDNLRIEVHR